MGLDMYLSKKSYVKNWDHQGAETRHTIEVRQGGVVRADIKPERISYIIEEVAYWRKANAIHRWFVEKVQDGRDECQESHVSREQLAELVDACKQCLGCAETVEGAVSVGTRFEPGKEPEAMTEPGRVLTNARMAASILPTQGGFFFGSTDYDSYYLDDLRDTVAMLEPLLDDGEGQCSSFYYRASW